MIVGQPHFIVCFLPFIGCIHCYASSARYRSLPLGPGFDSRIAQRIVRDQQELGHVHVSQAGIEKKS